MSNLELGYALGGANTTDRVSRFRAQQEHTIVIPLSSTDAIDNLLREAQFLHGWKQINFFRNRLQGRIPDRTSDFGREFLERYSLDIKRKQDETNAVMRVWKEAERRFAPEVADALVRIEEEARQRALVKLGESKTQILEEAKRYLVGYLEPRPTQPRLRFSSSTRLAKSADVEKLRASLHEMAKEKSSRETDAVINLLYLVSGLSEPGGNRATDVKKIMKGYTDGLEHEKKRYRLGQEFPVLHRLEPQSNVLLGSRIAAPSDQELLKGITTILSTTWEACSDVEKRVNRRMASSIDLGYVDGPSSSLGKQLSKAGMEGGGSFVNRFLGKPLGPWEFKGLIADTVHDLAGSEQSMTRQAVYDVYHAVNPDLAKSFAEMAALTGALVTLHLIAPPVAIAVDILLAAKGIVEVIASYLRNQDAYLCTLDPSESLGKDPSVIRLALMIVGELAGVIGRGGKAAGVALVAPTIASLSSE